MGVEKIRIVFSMHDFWMKQQNYIKHRKNSKSCPSKGTVKHLSKNAISLQRDYSSSIWSNRQRPTQSTSYFCFCSAYISLMLRLVCNELLGLNVCNYRGNMFLHPNTEYPNNSEPEQNPKALWFRWNCLIVNLVSVSKAHQQVTRPQRSKRRRASSS